MKLDGGGSVLRDMRRGTSASKLDATNQEQAGLIKELEKKIKELYVALDMEAVYLKYEEESYAELKGIMESQTVLPSELFGAMLAKIYKRQK